MRLVDVPVAGILSTTDDTWYTVPGATYASIEGVWVHNAHTAAVDVAVWINTGAADAPYLVNVSLDSQHTLYPQTPIYLSPGYTVHAQAGTDAVVHLYMSIKERTE